MKKIISILLSIVLCLTNIPIVAYAEEIEYSDVTYTEYSDMTDTEYAIAVIAEIMEINRILDQYGLTIDDFKDFFGKDPQFAEGLKKLLIEESETVSFMYGEKESEGVSEVTSSTVNWKKLFSIDDADEMREESKNDANMWAYAYEMAELNKKRDSKAKDIYSETKYMYMSHYIDIKSGVRYVVDKSISNDAYYSAWITDDDRDAYELYLKQTNTADRMLTTSKAIIGIISCGASIKTYVDLSKLEAARKIISNVANTIDLTPSGYSLIKNLIKGKKLVFDGNNHEVFMRNLRESLKLEDYDEQLLTGVRNTICALIVGACGGGFAGALIAGGAVICTFNSYVVKDIYDKARWLSLLYTNGLRVANRALRCYGLL